MTKKKQISEYEYDNIWMSCRYCIGRHTIASHCHANDIAKYEFDRLTDEQKQDISNLINDEIYNQLHIHNYISFENRCNIPKDNFRPLDIFYTALNECNIRNMYDLRNIYEIVADYNVKENKWVFETVQLQNDMHKTYRSMTDFSDLEVWQCLANLLDVSQHKTCKNKKNNEEITYYELVECVNKNDGLWHFEKVKKPISERQNMLYVRLNEENLTF